MTKKKAFKITCEGDMEMFMKQFLSLAKLKQKKKTIEVTVVSQEIGNILVENINDLFMNSSNALGNPENYHLHLFVEVNKKEDNE